MNNYYYYFFFLQKNLKNTDAFKYILTFTFYYFSYISKYFI